VPTAGESKTINLAAIRSESFLLKLVQLGLNQIDTSGIKIHTVTASAGGRKLSTQMEFLIAFEKFVNNDNIFCVGLHTLHLLVRVK
jgi:hypothetical protein